MEGGGVEQAFSTSGILFKLLSYTCWSVNAIHRELRAGKQGIRNERSFEYFKSGRELLR